jgi:hypothetical protein
MRNGVNHMQVTAKRPQDQTVDEWAADWEAAFTPKEWAEVMVDFKNVSKFAPKNKEEEKQQNWHRIDCLAANQLKVERDPLKLKKWFASQDEEWQAARKARFMSRLMN